LIVGLQERLGELYICEPHGSGYRWNLLYSTDLDIHFRQPGHVGANYARALMWGFRHRLRVISKRGRWLELHNGGRRQWVDLEAGFVRSVPRDREGFVADLHPLLEGWDIDPDGWRRSDDELHNWLTVGTWTGRPA